MGRAASFAAAVRKRGASIVLRTVTKGAAPGYLPNPATLTGAVLDLSRGAPAAGTMAIRAASAFGRLVPGDVIAVGGVAYTVTAEAAALTGTAVPGFPVVHITPALAPGPADGAPVIVTWAGDFTTRAVVSRYPNDVVDGTLIISQDLSVVIAAHGLPHPPAPTSQILFAGQVITVVDVTPVFIGDEVISYRVQAR